MAVVLRYEKEFDNINPGKQESMEEDEAEIEEETESGDWDCYLLGAVEPSVHPQDFPVRNQQQIEELISRNTERLMAILCCSETQAIAVYSHFK